MSRMVGWRFTGPIIWRKVSKAGRYCSGRNRGNQQITGSEWVTMYKDQNQPLICLLHANMNRHRHRSVAFPHLVCVCCECVLCVSEVPDHLPFLTRREYQISNWANGFPSLPPFSALLCPYASQYLHSTAITIVACGNISVIHLSVTSPSLVDHEGVITESK